MGFECSVNVEFSVAGGRSSNPVRQSRSEAVQIFWDKPFKRVLELDFSAYRHTDSTHAKARGVSSKRSALLGTVKNADPARLLPQDLLGGQSLHHTHRATASRTLPSKGFRVGRRYDSRRCGCEQSPA